MIVLQDRSYRASGAWWKRINEVARVAALAELDAWVERARELAEVARDVGIGDVSDDVDRAIDEAIGYADHHLGRAPGAVPNEPPAAEAPAPALPPTIRQALAPFALPESEVRGA